ncbi:MAG: TlpA family protein disulfide reductase [Gammaproteobacteria bacterium]|nr:TlpA family protein disulfide reductase [Gammaproteobacteria bacterium]
MAVTNSFVKYVLLFLFFFLTSAIAEEEKKPVDLTLKDINGHTIELSDYRGKWVVVNYWATWCPPCLEEIPDLVHFHEKYKDKDAVVIGINYEDVSMTRLSKFVDEYMINYPIIPMRKDDKPDSLLLGAIPGLPTTYLISPEGKLVARNVGPLTGEMIESFINKKKTASKKSPVQQVSVK